MRIQFSCVADKNSIQRGESYYGDGHARGASHYHCYKA
jgi:hypothetical protein